MNSAQRHHPTLPEARALVDDLFYAEWLKRRRRARLPFYPLHPKPLPPKLASFFHLPLPLRPSPPPGPIQAKAPGPLTC